jgi:ubiquinone/menaquinone biosynthesis C-methylase UbiE
VTDPNARFQGAIPQNYDRHLGPLLFEPFAQALARRLPVEGMTRVLETACGTGILTRQLREHLPSSARLVATDLNEPMMDLARNRLRAREGVEFRQADMAALPFPDGSFDAVVCQFGLMFLPDKAQAVREAKRVLGKGGLYLLNVWDSLEANELPRVAHEAIASFFVKDPPMFYQVPFSMHDRKALRALLADAGFTDVKTEDVELDSTSPAAAELAIGLVEGNPVGEAVRERGTVPIEIVIEAVATVVARACGDRPVKARLRTITAIGRA